MSGRTRVAPGRRRRAAAAAAARLAVGHPPRPGPAAPPTRSWIVQPVRDRATGARSMPDTNMAKFSFVVPCGPPSHTREPTQERRLCAETRHPGSHKRQVRSQRSNEPVGARSGNWRAQYARHEYGNSHSLCHAAPRPTHGSQQERGACAETRHPGSHGFATIQRAHQPSPHARDRVREPESILYCDCGGQADRQSVGRRMADERAVAEISRV